MIGCDCVKSDATMTTWIAIATPSTTRARSRELDEVGDGPGMRGTATSLRRFLRNTETTNDGRDYRRAARTRQALLSSPTRRPARAVTCRGDSAHRSGKARASL